MGYDKIGHPIGLFGNESENNSAKFSIGSYRLKSLKYVKVFAVSADLKVPRLVTAEDDCRGPYP